MILITIILFLAILVLSGCTNNSTYENNFSFTNTDGVTIELKEFKGKIVIVDFWYTTCQPCQYQMTELKKIYDSYSRDELEIISLNIAGESANSINTFINAFDEQLDMKLNWIFGIDDGTVWNEYKLKNSAVPTLYIFDQTGKVHFSEEGLSFYDEVPDNWPESYGDPTRLKPEIEELL